MSAKLSYTCKRTLNHVDLLSHWILSGRLHLDVLHELSSRRRHEARSSGSSILEFESGKLLPILRSDPGPAAHNRCPRTIAALLQVIAGYHYPDLPQTGYPSKFAVDFPNSAKTKYKNTYIDYNLTAFDPKMG